MLEKHGAIYSDRPAIPMGGMDTCFCVVLFFSCFLGEMVGWKNTLVLLPYGERFRTYRRLAHQLFGSSASMKSFHPVEVFRQFLELLSVLLMFTGARNTSVPEKVAVYSKSILRSRPKVILPFLSDFSPVLTHFHRTAGAIILRISHVRYLCVLLVMGPH